jgi:hypothetical protein
MTTYTVRSRYPKIAINSNFEPLDVAGRKYYSLLAAKEEARRDVEQGAVSSTVAELLKRRRERFKLCWASYNGQIVMHSRI